MQKNTLKKILSHSFIKFFLLPLFIVETGLLILYFTVNSLILQETSTLLLEDSKNYSQTILNYELTNINQNISEISNLSKILQNEHQHLFLNKQKINTKLAKFDTANNGVFYKTNKQGSSLYYSAKTKITQKEKEKAIFSEKMDISFASIVEANKNIVAVYFNSYDDMNRLYPYIEKVYDVYGSHIHMEDYNFYFLADKKHNPKKEPVWTSAYLDPAGNGWMISCVVPIYNNDFLEGVTGLDITIDNFVTNMLNKKLAHGTQILILNKDGGVIAIHDKIETLLNAKGLKEHNEFNLFTSKNKFALHLQKLINNKDDFLEFNINATNYIAQYKTVPIAEWKIILITEKEQVLSSLHQLEEVSFFILYITIIILVLFSFGLFYFLLLKLKKVSTLITEPILTLADETSHINKLGIKHEVINTEISEIYTLSKNFSLMLNELNIKTNNLINHELMLKDLNETLELKVKQRTSELQGMKDSLEKLARTDALTSLHNRYSLMELLKVEISRSNRYNEALSIMMLDIDFFKKVNDTYGHDVGDNVLVSFSNLIKKNLRDIDIAARYGGEEFFIILPNTELEYSKIFAERLKQKVSEYLFEDVGNITISIGLAEFKSDETIATLFKRVDSLLYKSKNDGRNRISF